MKRIVCSLIIIIILFMQIGCIKEKRNNHNFDSNGVLSTMKAIINEKEYIVELENNETAISFVNLLPKKYNMNELNGNEKYVYLEQSLPTNIYNPKRINAGDVMLYGDNCLVIFYKSFDTSYSYTKIGHINNFPELENDNIFVEFKK